MPNEILTTVYSAHTVWLQRVGATQGNDVIPFLRLIEEDIQRIFNTYRDRPKTAANQAAITKAIDAASRGHLQDYITGLKKSNREVGTNEAEFAASALNKIVIRDDFELIVPSAAQVNAIAIATPIKLSDTEFTTYTTMMRNYWVKWSDEIDAAIQNGFVNGTSINEIANNVFDEMRLQKSTTSKNLLNRAHRSAKGVATMGVNHYATQARLAFGEENSGIVKGYRGISVLDSRTSRVCQRYDQVVRTPKDKDWSAFVTPRHRWCRSAIVYEVDERFSLDDKDTKRASSFEVDGLRDPKPVSSEGIYYSKMKELKASDQDNALKSPTLGKAFRKLNNPTEFAESTVNSLGQPLTIKEMREADNELGLILQEMERKKKAKRKA